VSLFFETRCVKKFEIVFGDNGLSDVGVGFVREHDPALKKLSKRERLSGLPGVVMQASALQMVDSFLHSTTIR
jgi:hypothetical protein